MWLGSGVGQRTTIGTACGNKECAAARSSVQRAPIGSALLLGHRNSVDQWVVPVHMPECVLVSHVLEHVLGHMLEQVSVRHVLRYVLRHVLKNMPRHVPGHVLEDVPQNRQPGPPSNGMSVTYPMEYCPH